MAPYLEEHPPARSQYRSPRRQEVSGVIVVHTAENTPDFVAFDGGAEAVAKFIQHRSDAGSYHDLADSDSVINLVGYYAEAFHDATGTNPHSYGVSGATRADVWPLAPDEWREGCVKNMARAAANYAHWFHARRGSVIPARRITRTQSTNGVAGFISHAERDPGRRSDPGNGFPWNDFLAEYARLTADLRGETPTEDDMPLDSTDLNAVRSVMREELLNFQRLPVIWANETRPTYWYVCWSPFKALVDQTQAGSLVDNGLAEWAGTTAANPGGLGQAAIVPDHILAFFTTVGADEYPS